MIDHNPQKKPNILEQHVQHSKSNEPKTLKSPVRSNIGFMVPIKSCLIKASGRKD